MNNPLIHTIREACERVRIGHTGLYQAINAGALRAVKRGRRTLILDKDLVQYAQSLPLIKVKKSGAASSISSTTERNDADTGEMPSVRKRGRLQC